MNDFPTNPPYFFQDLNAIESFVQPSTVHIHNTSLSHYFRRYLLQKLISVYKWELPDEWSKNYFLYHLFIDGYIAIINTSAFGVIPQHCTISGYNVFYQPTNVMITNPVLKKSLTPRIGSECVLLKLTPDYRGLNDLICYYSDMLALCAESVQMNLVNSHMSYVFTAKDKASAESFKKLYDKIASGEVCAVIDSRLKEDAKSWDTFAQNVGQNYIADRVLSDMRKIEAMFDTQIGIPNANTDKRERLITEEVNANNTETFTLADMWLDNLKKGCEEVKNMFGVTISVDWRTDPIETGGRNFGTFRTGDA